MAKAVFRKCYGALYPDDPEGEAIMRTIKHGEHVMLEVKRPRNLGHHRLFFKLVQMVFENQAHYRSVDALVFALKVRLGYVESVVMKGNEVHFRPLSISFAKMDQAKFNEFFDAALKFFTEEVIPGMDSEALENEVRELVA